MAMLTMVAISLPAVAFQPTPLRRSTVAMASYTIDQTVVDGPLVPLTNYVLVEVDAARSTTSGGIVLGTKEKAQSGTIVSVGPGKGHKETGVKLPIAVKEGEHVLWGRYNGAELKYCGKAHTLLRDDDIALVWDGDLTAATARVVHGNVLLKVIRQPGETASGLVIAPNPEDDIPVEGEVVKKGEGALTRDGVPVPIGVEVGDCVKFRDYDTTEVSIEGQDYVVISGAHIICKWQKA
ncbi:hypothetical protein CTAYLR_009883 [Chrysophaeum taylorii]|uniref:20 kDa chaperonin, chloroplastic n=1 Tax=Chrysophaeum taylorii TaxID=2483200 RepID=A0AAD7XP82_9STRA|nr:hypothetical protein CTAYLR_009883 [Chrysophaeum taylorii]